MKTLLVIGGSGGIGAAIVAQYAKQQPRWQIVATFHQHQPNTNYPNVKWRQLDACNEQCVIELAKEFTHLDILINAIGFLHNNTHLPEKSISEFDPDFMLRNVRLNTLPSLLLAKHFMLVLKAKTPTHFVTLSAKIGSIEDNQLGGWVSYRSSKAALNMALKTISIEWRYKLSNCCVFAFHPGTTDTPLSKPFQSNVPPSKLFTPHYVAQCLMDLVDSTTSNNSGTFYSYDGTEIPW